MDRNIRRVWTEQELMEILTRSDSEDDFCDSSEDELVDVDREPEVAGPSSVSNVEPAPSGSGEQHTSDFSDDETEVDDSPQEETGRLLWSHKRITPTIHVFNHEYSGNKSQLTSASRVVDFFKLFFTHTLVNSICEQVNGFNIFCVDEATNEEAKNRLKKFKPVEPDEFYVFTALMMLMVRMKKLSLKEYWTNDAMFSTPFFSQVMARDRFFNILRFLHFSDNNLPPTGDRLFKIRLVVDYMREVFKKSFVPYVNLCIDKSLLLFKGNLFFKQYIPSKRSRFGIKTFVLCDCKTGYILDFIVYTGAESDIISSVKNIGKSGDIISSLMSPYLSKGHTLFVDNWYTSPTLFSWLHRMSTNACGTVRKNRKEMPPLTEKLLRGEVSYMTTNKLLALKWCDKREVWMLTTCHKMDMVEVVKKKTGEKVMKPAAIVDYNKNMGAVDRTDMLLSSVESVRKTVKWYKKLYYHLVDLAILNAHSLYGEVTQKKTPLAAFHKTLIHELIEDHHTPRNKRGGGRRSDEANANPLRLRERHFPSFIKPTEKKKTAQRMCVVCSKNKKRKDSRFECAPCNVGLCVSPCFETYHTIINY